MIEKFLKAKNWQLFLLQFGIPMLLQFVVMGTMFSNLNGGSGPNLPSFNFMTLFSVMMIFFTGTLFGWFWSVAVGLQSKVPDGVKMKLKKFKIFFFIPLIYILLIQGLMQITIKELNFNPWIFAFIVPLHLISMFCIFYNLYFVAKTIKTVELQREVSFSDFAGDFFLIWFYPIGIWIIQPRINRIIKG